MILTREVTITLQLTEEQISNVVVSALEGVTPYWAMSENGNSYNPSRWIDWEGDGLPCKPGVIVPGYVFCVLWDRDNGEPIEGWDGKVTPELIADGVARLMSTRYVTIEDIEGDGELADMALQYGAFGEVVYG